MSRFSNAEHCRTDKRATRSRRLRHGLVALVAVAAVPVAFSTAPAAAKTATLKPCTYAGATYSSGSYEEQRGHEMQCIDGDGWKSACSTASPLLASGGGPHARAVAGGGLCAAAKRPMHALLDVVAIRVKDL
jgi:hypothetical protein